MTANLRLCPEFVLPTLETAFAYPDDHGSFARATIRCVGVGKCRRVSPDGGVMCPRYQATREEKHSPRGRARLLFEMVRGETITDGWQSDEAHDALSLCLACKGCKRDCPVGVDMATYKAEFHSHYYAKRDRPPEHYAMGLIATWCRIAEKTPAFANAVAGTRVAKVVAGIDPSRSLPRFADRSFRRWFENRTAPAGGERVLLWPDT